MITAREAFLERVRQAVAVGNQAGKVSDHPGAWPGHRWRGERDLADLFAERFTAVGGTCHRAGDANAAIAIVDRLLTDKKARRIVLGRGPHLDALNLPKLLQSHGRQWLVVVGERDDQEAADNPHKRPLFPADVGITGVEWLVAETGSLVLASRPDQARSLSLLPPIHVAIAHRSQLLADLFDLFDKLSQAGQNPGLPACLNLITGPSKTGDIELKLVTGVHGPEEVHVVLMTD